ncbi:MAG: Arc family DNA-binding protein [Deltaproteobacteria bacterium]|nr:Arc family DNA-binding protein [Deltaproteobacteria bacterium]
MTNLTIKGIPEKLYKQLKTRAIRQRRSLNSEIIHCLELASSLSPLNPDSWLASADRLRTRLALTPVTEESLREAKTTGRP